MILRNGFLPLPTGFAYNAYMKANTHQLQYTIRNVSPRVDRALRKLARQQRKSLNQLVVDILERVIGATAGAEQVRYSDLDHLVGTWVADPEFDAVQMEQSKVDEELWS